MEQILNEKQYEPNFLTLFNTLFDFLNKLARLCAYKFRNDIKENIKTNGYNLNQINLIV
jgi:hypothetical protein